MTFTAEDSSPPIAELVAAAAHRQPQAPALVVSDQRVPISYRDLLRLSDDLAARLTRDGLLPGDRVGLRTRGGPEFVAGLLAASRAGLVVVPLDPALPVADQNARITAAGARVVLIEADQAGETAQPPFPCWPISVTAAASATRVRLNAAAAPRPSTAAPEGLLPDDALIMFTGGTTGVPKMVPWTHDNIARAVRSVIATYRLGPRDATVAVMPLFHGHGLIAALLATLASAGTVLLPAHGRFSAHTFADDLQAVRATWFTAVPTIHHILLHAAPAPRATRLRFIRSCSAALNPETARALRAVFGAPVLSAYGMTEATHQVSSTKDAREIPAAGLVGRSTGPEIRIVGDDGTPCPPDTVGEVWLRGPTVVRGYLGDAAATARTFTDGWLRTGDLGSLSAGGELTLRGRIKELINRGGEKISPERVEAVLAGHPDVAEAAVFGVPDPVYGEIVAALIVPTPSASPSPAALAAFCRERLAAFEVPATIRLTNELPHTAKGSVDRRAVAEGFRR
ncbi:FadD7 family fatty acid--CoA ligase [Mycobacterium sp. SM1]|uniref:FadD7 family fatty acid--CoA ligase n=1 Tax=Mycobacterium sp. SM1 TaxID=2816243 RepID=UPI001BCDBD85|nr:FadD7 family fatty acid--CoA ligase [Mycobacterium sp. SM1]MBS4727633.1 FadD7 family fatty acid--CoA ligase [Mycobacterium sp. SM1]